MAIRVFLLVDTAPGSDIAGLVNQLQEFDATQRADAVTGPHDIICTVQVNALSDLGPFQERVHTVPGVTRTMTCVSLGR